MPAAYAGKLKVSRQAVAQRGDRACAVFPGRYARSVLGQIAQLVRLAHGYDEHGLFELPQRQHEDELAAVSQCAAGVQYNAAGIPGLSCYCGYLLGIRVI